MRECSLLLVALAASAIGGCSSMRPDCGDATFSGGYAHEPDWLTRALLGKFYSLTLPPIELGPTRDYAFAIEHAPGMTMTCQLRLANAGDVGQLKLAGTRVDVEVVEPKGGTIARCSGMLEADEVLVGNEGWHRVEGDLGRFVMYQPNARLPVPFVSGSMYQVKIRTESPQPLSSPVLATFVFVRGSWLGP